MSRSRFNLNRNGLKKAPSPLRQYGWFGTQFQVKLVRQRLKNGKYRTKSQIIRGKREYHGNNRGLLHKAVNLKYRVKGDIPSISKNIKSIQPYTRQGRIAKYALQSTYTTAKATIGTSTNAVIKTGLAAETTGLKLSGFAVKETARYVQQKYREDAVDDYNKGVLAGGRIAVDAVKGTYSHFKQKKQNQLEKERYRLKKQELYNFRSKCKPKFAANRQNVRIVNQKYRLKKELYLYKNAERLSDSTYKNLLKRQKKRYKFNKKALKIERKHLKTDKRFTAENVRNQRKIARHSYAGVLAIQPVKYTGNRMKASAWQKAAHADENNDFMELADKTKTYIYEPVKQHYSKPSKLQREQKERDKLENKEDKQHQKLQKQDYKLQEKKNNEKVKKQKKVQKKDKDKSEKIRDAFVFIKNALSDLAEKFIGIMFLPALLILLIIAFIMLIFSSCTSSSGFVLATYTAHDYDLTKAEVYYTNLAQTMNRDILLLNGTGWKYGLGNLGVDTSEMPDQPTELYWGNSPYLNYDPVYDFDPYMLWSFLCTYYYDFSDNTDDEVEESYWEFGDDTKALIKELFTAEYLFDYHYDNTSGWDELPNYVFASQDGYRKKCLENNLEWDNAGNVIGTIKTDYNPTSLSYFTRKNDDGTFTTFYRLDNLEILNYKKNYTATGWYVMDEGMTITSGGNRQTGMYEWNDYEGWGYYVGNTWHDRDTVWFSWYMPNTGIELKNTPIATIAKADAAKMGFPDSDTYGRFTYYQKYDWVEDCRLYYNVKQLKTFEEAIKDKLESMDYSEERLQYYMLLVGDDGNKYYGNHQILNCIFEGDTIIDYVNSGHIYHGYGYDMQEWNQIHCSLYGGLHKGIDVLYPSNAYLYSPLECVIDSYDADKETIVLRKNDLNYWYENGASGRNRDTKITICNAKLLSGYSEGDSLEYDEQFAISTGQKKCDNIDNSVVGYDYVHIKVEVDTNGIGWDFIDPRLVFH